MKTMDELKAQFQNAINLSEKIAIRIKMIELNRLSQTPDVAINSPIAAFLSDLQQKIQPTLELR